MGLVLLPIVMHCWGPPLGQPRFVRPQSVPPAFDQPLFSQPCQNLALQLQVKISPGACLCLRAQWKLAVLAF